MSLMPPEETSPNVFRVKHENQEFLATRNMTPGRTYYGEPTFTFDDVEYRSWNPTRSKLAAAILKGLKELPIKPGSTVLYLGAASGTTVSHVSDVVGQGGHVWALDFSPRALRDLLDKVSRHRENISPILGDARKPETYSVLVPKVDVVFADVAQPDQADIVVKNARWFLKKGGHVMLSIKARSIDVTEKPSEVFKAQVKIMEESGLKVNQLISLDPYEKDHAMVLALSA